MTLAHECRGWLYPCQSRTEAGIASFPRKWENVCMPRLHEKENGFSSPTPLTMTSAYGEEKPTGSGSATRWCLLPGHRLPKEIPEHYRPGVHRFEPLLDLLPVADDHDRK